MWLFLSHPKERARSSLLPCPTEMLPSKSPSLDISLPVPELSPSFLTSGLGEFGSLQRRLIKWLTKLFLF